MGLDFDEGDPADRSWNNTDGLARCVRVAITLSASGV
jgi:hypothetical protein